MQPILINWWIGGLVLLSSCLHAQELKLTTTSFIGGNTTAATDVYDAIITSDEGIFWCGKTYDSGSGMIPRVIVPWDNRSHTIVGKVDSLGNNQWIKVLTGTADAGAVSACEVPGGGYAILTDTPVRRGDIRLQRLDPAGNVLWTKSFGSSLQEGVCNVISTSDKGFLILGLSQGSDGDIPYNYTNPPIPFQPWDYVLIKTDSLGVKQWVKVLGTSGDEFYGKVITDGKYYYLCTSAVTKDHDFVDTVGRSGFTGRSAYVLKLDSAGTLLFSKAYGSALIWDAFFDDRDSSIVMIGQAGSNLFEFQGNHGGQDLLLFKTTRQGGFKWAHQYGDQNTDRGYSVAKYLTTGYIVGGNTIKSQQTQYSHISRDDSWIWLTDSVGNPIAQKIFGGYWDEQVTSVFVQNGIITAVGNTPSFSFTEGFGQQSFRSDSLTSRPGIYFSRFQIWPLSVPNSLGIQRLKISPNPAHSSVNIELPPGHATGILVCLDAAGKLVHRQPVAATETLTHISTINWLPGIYSVCWQAVGEITGCERLLLR